MRSSVLPLQLQSLRFSSQDLHLSRNVQIPVILISAPTSLATCCTVFSNSLFSILCFNVSLLHQANFFQLFVQTSDDHLLNDIFRFVRVLRIILSLSKKDSFLMLFVLFSLHPAEETYFGARAATCIATFVQSILLQRRLQHAVSASTITPIRPPP